MSKRLIDRLTARVIELESPILVGLDPQLSMFPEEVVASQVRRFGDNPRAYAAAIVEFNRAVIDAVEGLTAAVKPQIAFYEALGVAGLQAYVETCDYAYRRGLFVVADSKRGDIGSTSAAYAEAFLDAVEPQEGRFYSDFVTVNPYLGDDCLKEFVKRIDARDKGMFVLVKTSNPSSAQLQDLEIKSDGRTIYQAVADLVESWSSQRVGECGLSSIGAVIGATHPEQLGELRKRMPTSLFLVPGYGAQGGTARDIVTALRPDGTGALINSSRGIIYAKPQDGESYTDAIRRAAQTMRDDIRAARKEAR
ncbi:MAG: orotidine-5'-phosphate decarboxylase [Bacillota bacterium]|nr:orotidine-5'-phosphate decarboxylase [Bacillota bacterium]